MMGGLQSLLLSSLLVLSWVRGIGAENFQLLQNGTVSSTGVATPVLIASPHSGTAASTLSGGSKSVGQEQPAKTTTTSRTSSGYEDLEEHQSTKMATSTFSASSKTSGQHISVVTEPAIYTGYNDDWGQWCFYHWSTWSRSVAITTMTTHTWTDTITLSNTPAGTTWVSKATNTLTETTTVVPSYSSPPQCGQACFIFASSVDLLYWPTPASDGTITPAPQQTASKSAIVDGQTLYSPSNYLVFHTIAAGVFNFAIPGDNWALPNLGEVIDKTTLSFGQFDLSTYMWVPRPTPSAPLISSAPLDNRAFNKPVPYSVYLKHADPLGIYENGTYSSINEQQWSTLRDQPKYASLASPSIQMPLIIKTGINSLWTTCDIDGVFDPPSALSNARPLTAFEDHPPVQATSSTPLSQPESTTSSGPLQPTFTPAATPGSTARPDQPASTNVGIPVQTSPSQASVNPGTSPTTTSTVSPDPAGPAESSAPASSVDPQNRAGSVSSAESGPSSPVQVVKPTITIQAQPVDPTPSVVAPQDPPTSPSSKDLGAIIASMGGVGAPSSHFPGPSTTIGLDSTQSSPAVGDNPAAANGPQQVVVTIPAVVTTNAAGSVSTWRSGLVTTVLAAQATSFLVSTLPPVIITDAAGSISTLQSAIVTSVPVAIDALPSSLTIPAIVTTDAAGSSVTLQPEVVATIPAVQGSSLVVTVPAIVTTDAAGSSLTLQSQIVTTISAAQDSSFVVTVPAILATNSAGSVSLVQPARLTTLSAVPAFPSVVETIPAVLATNSDGVVSTLVAPQTTTLIPAELANPNFNESSQTYAPFNITSNTTSTPTIIVSASPRHIDDIHISALWIAAALVAYCI